MFTVTIQNGKYMSCKVICDKATYNPITHKVSCYYMGEIITISGYISHIENT